MQEPLVSVLMTSYNREKYIAEAIESVLASTYKNFELIIVDDVSKDNTVSIAKAFEAKDNRIKVYVNDKNLTDYPNRNKAASYASGKYLKYLDSDDTIHANGLEYCINEMEKYPQASFGLSMIDGDHSSPSILMESESVIRKHLFHSNHLAAGPSGMIIRRDFFEKINGFNTEFRMANDSFFNVKAAILTPVVLLKNNFFHYRMHGDQEQNNPQGYFVYGYLANKEIVNTLKLPLTDIEIKTLKNKYKRQHARALIKHIVVRKKIREALLVMKKTNFGFIDIVTGVL